MEKFYKSNYLANQNKVKKNSTNPLEFQIIEWWAQDEESNESYFGDSESENEDGYNVKCRKVYNMWCFGATKTGISVSCKIIGFKPYYFVKVDDKFNKSMLNTFLDYVQSSYILKKKIAGEWSSYYYDSLERSECRIVKRKDLFGFTNGKIYKYVKLVFRNYEALTKSRYIFKKPIDINGITKTPTKFKLYESNFDPFMRYCHLKDIRMAGWIELPRNKYKHLKNTAKTELCVEIDRRDVISLKDKKEIANFLQASWDIEVYSYDYTFPDPKKSKNEIFQIATTYKYYYDIDKNEPNKFSLNKRSSNIKHLLTLKKCSKIDDPDVIVEECKNEKDLIIRWVDTICKMDPDIFYTYNGDSFDCMYLKERAKEIYGVKFEKFIYERLSRLQHIPCVVKTEYFSSSAYGDSDFTRMYIPGRLNYDLLIHFKRGMKKYPSYKLDYISNEILGEGKHDVTAKDIFGFYETGDPDKIRHIGQYCIQDTELLQKLVDKQLVLTNIIQLANVTFVPIGFLTTRGQSIKVYSQLLRKAQQMHFLVPHTNFNEDSYPVKIKFKQKNPIATEDINEYIELSKFKKISKMSCKVKEIKNDKTLVLDFRQPHNLDFRSHINIGEQCGANNEIYTFDVEDEKTLIVKTKNPHYVTEESVGRSFELYKRTNNSNAGKISEVLDDNNIIVLLDTEITSKMYNQTVKFKKRDYLVDLYPFDDPVDNSFTGATVLEPRPGMYDDNIAVLDFASLYPTIMISRNLCYSTFVIDKSYLGIPDVNYEKIAWDDKIEYTLKQTCLGVGKTGKSKGQVCGKPAFFEIINEDMSKSYYCRIHDPYKKTRHPDEKFQKKDVSYDYTVVQPHIDKNGERQNVGVLPALLEELYSERKQVKKQMARARDSGDLLLADILDSTQLAIKVSLNSTYGYLGRCTGNLVLKELGSIVTSVGRMLIEQSKEYAEGEFLKYLKQNNVLTQTISKRRDLLDNMSKTDKLNVLKKFSKTIPKQKKDYGCLLTETSSE